MSAPEPTSGPSTRRSARRRALAIGLGLAVLALAAALGWGRGEGREGAAAAAASAPAGAQQSGRGGGRAAQGSAASAAAAEAPAHAPEFEPAVCWNDLERFDAEVTLATFREWSAPMLASRDGFVRDYLKERLGELIGGDPARALEVLGWAQTAEDRSYGLFLRAVRDSEAVQRPEVSSRLLELGLDPRLPSERRAGILSALDTQRRLTPQALTQLTRFAKDPVSGEAGWAATRTIARVMKREHAQRADISPYLTDLLTIGAESPDEQIRYLGQMMPMHAAPLLDADATARFEQILLGEGNEAGRDAAAHNLSLSSDKARVLALFASTFPKEPSVCVRWALFRFSARTAGKRALPVMARMAELDPRFAAPYRDFEHLYALGTLDFVRVWQGLQDQDPFHCLDRHE
ncbi:hypothetical protein FGE12_21245 [Aggregicoccus sp. 17bor-14]|uniref:hypothetical protein n=1 Tax=Myxococcaceae TaxID=31 RepID=UPI00129CF7F3|nr:MULTISPECIES: hypothetical protein [Myxococcaceae]MBF5044941.1 hypothetical protein [Simulacricoccus sp. 17bor-14]MRI90684.1 hypothetical protein [Aggregicoccus sp. 17bor-14]